MKLFSSFFNWYFGRNVLPYWCIVIFDFLLCFFGAAFVMWLRHPLTELLPHASDQGKTYDFNTADKLNTLLINALVSTGELKEIEEYDVDFDHQFLDGSEDGIRAACTKGRMIREMAHQL